MDRPEDYAVSECINLEAATFEADVQFIGVGNFQGCSRQFHIIGPVGATSLEAFMDESGIDYNTYYAVLMANDAIVALFPMRAGDELDLPQMEDTDTKLFLGWTFDAAGDQLWTGGTMPAHDLLMFAKWGNEFGFEELDWGIRLTHYNGRRTEIVVPAIIDEQEVLAIADDCFPDSTVTLVGKRGGFVDVFAAEHSMAFKALKHTITFNSDGGTPIDSVMKEATDPLDDLPTPVKDGYTFQGWKEIDPEYGTSVYYFRMPPKDISLNALWLAGRYDEETGEWIVVQAPEVPFTFTAAEGGVAITGYTGNSAEATIPEAINGQTVVAIADTAFAGNRTLRKLTIPAGVKRIGASAFEGGGLVEISILGAEQIGERAFYDCGSLTSVSLPQTLTALGDFAFASCQALLSVELPAGLTALPESVFQGDQYLEYVELPAALETVGDYAFYGCRRLGAILLGANVSEIGEAAFDGCTALRAIAVDEGNPYYCAADGVLFNRAGNALIRYPEGKADPAYAVPAGVTLLAEKSLRNSRIETLTLGANTTTVGASALEGSNSLSALVLNDGLEEIGSRAFAECLGLKTVEIPDSVAALMPGAFSLTGLRSVTIPEYTQIGRNAIPENANLIIYGVAGSDAERYALEHGIRFIDPTRDIPVTGIALSEEALTIQVRETHPLAPALTPADTTETTVRWSSSDNTVIRVDSNGVILGRSAGTATVTATAANGATASCLVTVSEPAPSVDYDSFDLSQADFWLSDAITEIGVEAFMGIDAQIVVIPAACRLIAGRAFSDCANLLYVYFEDGDNVSVADDFLAGSAQARVLAPEGSRMADWKKP